MMADFVTKLSNASWDTVFDSNDVDSKFNCFLNTHLRIFYSTFPLKRVKNETKSKTWITVGIKTSRKCKRQLYLASRDSNDPRLKSHYKMYCKILTKVIKEAKRNNYNCQILESNKKIKTTSDIVIVESGKKTINEDVQVLNTDGKSTNNPQAMRVPLMNISFLWLRKYISIIIIIGPLSPRHGASLGCGYRRRPPDMDGSCEYIE
jgi:predicted SAM-dependent methyltransferase